MPYLVGALLGGLFLQVERDYKNSISQEVYISVRQLAKLNLKGRFKVWFLCSTMSSLGNKSSSVGCRPFFVLLSVFIFGQSSVCGVG